MPDNQMCVWQIESSKTCIIRVIVELSIKVMVCWAATPCSLINTAVLEKKCFLHSRGRIMRI
jgi:hypothetical protein